MKLWILFVICCILPAFSTALKCYQCESIKDAECKNPTDKFVKDCPSGSKGCRTDTGELNGKDVVSRSCLGSGSNGCQDYEEGGKKAKMCSCTGDKCNSSCSVTSTLFIFVPMCLAIIIYNSISLL